MSKTKSDIQRPYIPYSDIQSRKRAHIPDIQCKDIPNSADIQDFEDIPNPSDIQFPKHIQRPSVKLELTAIYTLTVRYGKHKEEYEFWTRAKDATMFDKEYDRKSGPKRPLTPTQLIDLFRGLVKKGSANYHINHGNGLVERWDEHGYGRWDPRGERRQLQRWIKEHSQEFQ
jgi:hypothetical protein